MKLAGHIEIGPHVWAVFWGTQDELNKKGQHDSETEGYTDVANLEIWLWEGLKNNLSHLQEVLVHELQHAWRWSYGSIQWIEGILKPRGIDVDAFEEQLILFDTAAMIPTLRAMQAFLKRLK